MKNVLVINCCNTSNFGDQAIGVTMKKMLEQKNCQVDLVDLIKIDEPINSDKDYSEKSLARINEYKKTKKTFRTFLSKKLALVRWRIKNTPKINKISQKKYDVLIFGGGELVQSNGIFPLAINTWIKALKKHSHISKTVFFGVGVTGNYTFIDKYRLSRALRFADEFYVRDTSSQKNLKDTFNIESECICDVVFGTFERQFSSNVDNKTVLYGITAFSRLKRYSYKNFNYKEEYYEDCYNEILNKDYLENIKLFYSDVQDYIECHSFSKFVLEHHNKKLPVSSVKTLEDFEKEIAECRCIISPRMHACIFGIIYNKEVTPVLVSKKMKSFYDEYMNVSYKKKEFREKVLNALDCAISNKE